MSSVVQGPHPSWGVWAALAFWGASWGHWGLSEHSSSALTDGANHLTVLLLTGIGLTILLVLTFRSMARPQENNKALLIAFVGLFLGLLMYAVVAAEPGNFYSVSAGVVASLVLALSATAFNSPDAPLASPDDSEE